MICIVSFMWLTHTTSNLWTASTGVTRFVGRTHRHAYTRTALVYSRSASSLPASFKKQVCPQNYSTDRRHGEWSLVIYCSWLYVVDNRSTTWSCHHYYCCCSDPAPLSTAHILQLSSRQLGTVSHSRGCLFGAASHPQLCPWWHNGLVRRPLYGHHDNRGIQLFEMTSTDSPQLNAAYPRLQSRRSYMILDALCSRRCHLTNPWIAHSHVIDNQ